MSIDSIKIGDLIVRQKGPFSTHYLVYVGIHNGVQMVAENQIGSGVRYIRLDQALAGNPIKRFEKFGGAEHERALVIPKINSLIGNVYDLIAFNCEHFARLISNGIAESKQVATVSNIAIAGGGAGLFIAAISKNRNMAIISFIILIIGILGHFAQENAKSKR